MPNQNLSWPHSAHSRSRDIPRNIRGRPEKIDWLEPHCGGSCSKEVGRDLPGTPVAKTLLPMQRAWVQSLLRELDPT